MQDTLNYNDYQNDQIVKKYDGRINRHHLGILFWRLGVAFSIIFIVLLLARTLISITSIIIFMIGLVILSFIFLITLGTILIIDKNHGRHWKNLINILENRETALLVIDKILTFVPLICSVIIAFNIFALILLYTSKLPVRRFRLVTAIIIIILNIVALIYALAGGNFT